MGRLAAPGVLALAVGIAVHSAVAIAGDTGRSPEHDLAPWQRRWLARLDESRDRLTKARTEVARLERQLVSAKNHEYPRGEALGALRKAAAEAHRELDDATTELSELLPLARVQGINPYWLRDYRAALDAASPAGP